MRQIILIIVWNRPSVRRTNAIHQLGFLDRNWLWALIFRYAIIAVPAIARLAVTSRRAFVDAFFQYEFVLTRSFAASIEARHFFVLPRTWI